MLHERLYRNIRAGEYLDAFLVSAVSSLLLLRFFLSRAGYPQVGGGSLHIAHMLWGGLLMLIAIVCCLAFLGRLARKLSSVIGGIGFGIFIDELGKFITKDNDYFFRPTIGIIYAIFITLYLVFRFVSHRTQYTSKEYLLNALDGLEEAVALDLDTHEKQEVLGLLQAADQKNPLTQHLIRLLHALDTIKPPQPSIFSRLGSQVDKLYRLVWSKRRTNTVVRALATLFVVLFLFGIVLTVYANVDSIIDAVSGNHSYSVWLLIGQIVAAAVAAGFSIFGIVALADNHIAAFTRFRQAALVNIFLTEFFLFTREQFGAIPSFVANLLLLILLNFVLYEERRAINPAGITDTN